MTVKQTDDECRYPSPFYPMLGFGKAHYDGCGDTIEQGEMRDAA